MGPSKKKKKVAITSTACQAIRVFFFNTMIFSYITRQHDLTNPTFELRATKISGVPHLLAVSPVLSLEI